MNISQLNEYLAAAMNILPHTGTKPTIVMNKAKYIRTVVGYWIVNDVRQIYIYMKIPPLNLLVWGSLRLAPNYVMNSYSYDVCS